MDVDLYGMPQGEQAGHAAAMAEEAQDILNSQRNGGFMISGRLDRVGTSVVAKWLLQLLLQRWCPTRPRTHANATRLPCPFAQADSADIANYWNSEYIQVAN